jgi:uncharacterized protein
VTRRPFLVDVVALRRHPGHREHLVCHGRLDGLVVTGSAISERADVAVDVVLEAVEGGLVVKGTVSAPWVGECRRCLRELSGEAVATVEEVFVAEPEPGETWPLERDQIDLEPLVREVLVLELPLALLCRDDCAGLCPRCGADRNEGTCRCVVGEPDPRWAALDVLRQDTEG